MYYAVFDLNDSPLYIGSDSEKAIAAFNRGGVGATLETATDEDALNELLSGDTTVGACGVKGCCVPMCEEPDVDEDDWEDFFNDDEDEVTLEDVKEAVNDVVDATLDRLGVTREDVQDFVGRVKDRGTEAAEDTKALARKGLGVLGNVFTKIGERLSKTAE